MEQKSFFSNTQNQILGTLALLMVIIALGAYATYTFKQAENIYGSNTIMVTGEGEVTAVPDIGQFSFMVMAKGKDAILARTETNTKTNEILAFLKEQGVAEVDIKTENYTMYPTYEWVQKPCPVGTFCQGESVQDGFEISQTIMVKVRDLEKAGELLAGAGDKGATNLSNLQFTIDDPSVLEDAARVEAIANAKAKADMLARELGVRIVKMVSFYEEENYLQPYYGNGMGGDMMMAKEGNVSPEIPTGENVTKSRVSITYQIK